MPCRYPLRMSYTVADLSERWNVPASDIRQWLSGGDLTAMIWLPVMSVIQLDDRRPEVEEERLCHWEGYTPVSSHQCRRLFRQGWIALREFSTQDRLRNFRLPETSDDLVADLHDLVVLEAERRRFEAAYPVLAGALSSEPLASARKSAQPVPDPSFRVVRTDDGREFRFGDTQAKVLRLLAEAARDGQPWQSGKTLLRGAGSQSFSVSNLFKRHPAWREIIISNGRGFYRLADSHVEQARQPCMGS